MRKKSYAPIYRVSKAEIYLYHSSKIAKAENGYERFNKCTRSKKTKQARMQLHLAFLSDSQNQDFILYKGSALNQELLLCSRHSGYLFLLDYHSFG